MTTFKPPFNELHVIVQEQLQSKKKINPLVVNYGRVWCLVSLDEFIRIHMNFDISNFKSKCMMSNLVEFEFEV